MDIIENEVAEGRVRSGRGRLASVALIGAGVIAGGTLATLGVANAGTVRSTTSTPTPTATGHAPYGQAPDGAREFGRGMGPGFGERLGGHGIHGTETVQTGTNTFATIDSQRGTVTVNDGTNVTVKSADGFTATYSFNSSSIVIKGGAKGAIADLKVGDTVELRATVPASGNPIVVVLLDGKPAFGPGDGHGFGGPDGVPGGGAPYPTASPTSGV